MAAGKYMILCFGILFIVGIPIFFIVFSSPRPRRGKAAAATGLEEDGQLKSTTSNTALSIFFAIAAVLLLALVSILLMFFLFPTIE